MRSRGVFSFLLQLKRAVLVRLFLAAGVVGALAFALWAETPVSAPPPSIDQVEWRLPVPSEPASGEVKAAWQQPIWSSQTLANAIVPNLSAAPRFTLLGIVQSGERLEALLSTEAGERLRLEAGAPLPGGGTLRRVLPNEAVWVDPDGHETAARLLNGPPPKSMGSRPAPAQ